MSTVIGQPINRVDGRLKVTGAAKYAGDYPGHEMAYGVPVQSAIARGKVLKIDTTAARKAPGVLHIITRENAPKLQKPKNDFGSSTKLGEDRMPFADDRIYYAGQYLGLVVADSIERAMEAAALVKVDVEEEGPVLDIGRGERFQPPDDFAKTNLQRGDPESAFRSAQHQIHQTYTTPVEHHNPMEPSATTAAWEGDRLTLYDATQWVVGARNVVADAMGIPRENVHLISKYVGGGFGCKGFVWPHAILAAAAAKELGRPVKIVLTREQMFTSVGHRGATEQQVSLGADTNARLVAIQHENVTHASMVDDFIERSGVITGFLYECPNVLVKNIGARVNIATPTPMRAPGESPGLWALESAFDELAWELKIDPVELRLRNYSERDQEKNLPYSSKHLRECYQIGMERFGWKQRQNQPRSHRDGRYLVGWGMATATYPAYRSPGAARVRLLPDGTAVVSSATQDIGTGTYTTMTQVAADALGIPPEKIKAELGDSTLPPAPVSGGSMTSASVSPAVKAAAEDALRKLIRYAIEDENSPLHGMAEDRLTAANGYVHAGDSSSSVSYGDVLKSKKVSMIEGEAKTGPGAEMKEYAFHSFGAQFSEVRVDSGTGEARVTRHVGVFDVGRVLNRKTARSQALGGITFGIGMALMEHTVYDRRHGRVITNNLADYAVPVNADVPNIDVAFIDQPDFISNSVGARGMGEIGITGVAPAIANAIYHATGIRVRDLPITPDKLLGGPA
ncbi:MAG: xanthine dehydrogenase family protein molybdopterin-binding subunit [Bryobacteraceae bacterium]